MSVEARDIIYLFRIFGESGNAWKVALQTGGESSESREYETSQTKDGVRKTAGMYDASHSINSLLPKGDSYISKLKGLVRNPKPLEIWAINRTEIDGETTLPGEYSKNVVTEVSQSAGAEGVVEVAINAEVSEGTVVDGEVTVTPELAEMLKNIADEVAFEQPTAGA